MEPIEPAEDAPIYTIDLPEFEGPLDLLLSLIEREELDITRISLAYVTDQYLAYLDLLKEINPDELTDFLVVAAKLILIKSEMLLPRPPPSLLADEEEEDLGDELARQLLTYKKFKEAAGEMREVEVRGERAYVRTAPPMKGEPRLMPGEVSLLDLLEAARQALAIKPPDPGVDEMVSPETISIGQQMAHIRRKLVVEQDVSFLSLLAAGRNRLEIIVTLLAVLELIKRQVIQVEQPQAFGDLLIVKNQLAPELTESEWAELTGLTDVT